MNNHPATARPHPDPPATTKRSVLTHPLLSFGFRPFFLGAAIWGALAVPLWIAVFFGYAEPASAFDFLGWHVHEMLYGFAAAAVAGFLLTAIPNWTGRLPVQGSALGTLVLLWIAGRVAVCFGALIGPWATFVVDGGFLAILLVVVLREVVAGRNWRNLPVATAVAALLAGNVLMHLEALDIADTARLGERLGIAVVVLLIGLIGGRIVPSFTRNWLAKRQDPMLPTPFGGFDKLTLLVTLAALVLWLVLDMSPMAGAALLGAAALQALRLARWRGLRSAPEPMLWILHLGYAWIPIGLALLGLAGLNLGVPESAGIHALTAGAMGTMILAVMTRATLGHTGRVVTSDGATRVIYGAVLAAAVARAVGAFSDEYLLSFMVASAALWSLAFALFAIHYGRMLLTPRVDASR